MPRTNLCKSKQEVATEKLYRWIKHQEKQKVMAKAIGVSEQLFSYKLRCYTLSTKELMQIFHFLRTEPEEIVKLMTY